MDEILCSWGPGEIRLALVEDGGVAELRVGRGGCVRHAIFLGRVVEVAPQMNASFVDIGTARPGLLDGASGRTVGQAILVQVRAEPQGGKGAVLTADLRLPGRLVSYSGFRKGVRAPKGFEVPDFVQALLQGNEGVMLRPPAYGAPRNELAAEIAAHRLRWAGLEAARKDARAPAALWAPDAVEIFLADRPWVRRVAVDDRALFAGLKARLGDAVECTIEFWPDCFAAAEEAFDEALAPSVALASGGRITVERAAALTAIDVDSGPGDQTQANREAADAVARQLRLRGIGGQIVVDFVSASGRHALDRIVDRLRKAVAADPVPTHVIGATRLGLVEVTRERHGPALDEVMLERLTGPAPRAAAFAALRRAVAEAAHRPGRALALRLAPDLAATLAAEPAALAEAEARIGRPLLVRAEPGRALTDTLIEDQ